MQSAIAEQRAVAAEHDDDVRRLRRARLVGDAARRSPAASARPSPVSKTGCDAARSQPRLDVDQVRRRRAQMRLGDDADASDRTTVIDADPSRLKLRRQRCRRRGRATVSRRSAPCAKRRCRKNSWLPVAPVIGDGAMAMRVNPDGVRRVRRRARSPPRGRPDRVTSRACRPRRGRPRTAASRARRRRRPAPRNGGSAGRMCRSEMNETSIVTRSTACGTSSAVSARALTPSRTITRGSLRSRQSSWPWPTSSAMTLRGAALEQHVGEAAGRGADVERAAAGGSTPKASSACASLTPPRPTYG